MALRELPSAEWHRLEGFGHFATCPLPNPAYATILVDEDEDGVICGSWFAHTVVFLEGLHIDPAHRNPGAARRLFHGMITLLRERGVKAAFTITIDEAVGVLADKAGFARVPGTLHLLTLGGK